MPDYDFKCGDCGRGFTLAMSVSERGKNAVHCPDCGSANVQQSFARVQFGGGSSGCSGNCASCKAHCHS